MLHFEITLVKLIYNLKKKIFLNGNDVLILLPKIINLKKNCCNSYQIHQYIIQK